MSPDVGPQEKCPFRKRPPFENVLYFWFERSHIKHIENIDDAIILIYICSDSAIRIELLISMSARIKMRKISLLHYY
jgi:hypothetical protein